MLTAVGMCTMLLAHLRVSSLVSSNIWDVWRIPIQELASLEQRPPPFHCLSGFKASRRSLHPQISRLTSSRPIR